MHNVLYLLAIVLPPIAMLFAGKLFQAIVNIPALVVGVIGSLWGLEIAYFIWGLCIVHALVSVYAHLRSINR